MRIDIITSLPEFFDSFLSKGNIGRAISKGMVDIVVHSLRDFTEDQQFSIDDYPYGGGPGMILKAEPIFNALEYVKKNVKNLEAKVLYLTPQGELYTQSKANELSKRENFIILSGRYKGIDQRVRETVIDEEISIGDYVLSGGEIPALVLIDSIIRLKPGVMGNVESAMTDSFQDGYFDCPYYTRPENFRGLTVPEVLLSGNHAKIKEWRKKKAKENTMCKRRDLVNKPL